VDASGHLFIADSSNSRIREVNLSSGLITTFAGGPLGDNGPAVSAALSNPEDVAVDAEGDIFIADTDDNRIREINSSTGLITTVAGNGTAGYGGDNGPATAAKLYYPEAVAVDANGDLFIADQSNNRIREVNLSSGLITTVAGSGTAGYGGDNGLATAAQLNHP
jgi:sugar lactone lactonase YvrE